MSNGTMKKRIMDFTTQYTLTNGGTPSYREIGEAVGLKSSSSVSEYIEQLIRDGKLVSVNQKAQTFALARRVEFSDADEIPRRIRLEVADGGVLFVDCSLLQREFDSVAVSFSGIVDASQMKGKVAQVVSCRIDDGV